MEGGSNIFSLGASKQDNKDQAKKVGENKDRMSAFGVGDERKDVKRERDNFAVDLRKKKRDELQKRRRGLLNSQEDSNQTPNPTPGDIDLN